MNPRILFQIEKSASKPEVVFIAGIHGNEQSGIEALLRVYDQLVNLEIPILGSIYALRGNLRAIHSNVRFVDMDLNRAWTKKNIHRIEKNGIQYSEDHEVTALKKFLDHRLEHRNSPITLVDLHTTSSISPPFAIFDDSLRNRKLANKLPVPKVLGIIEQLHGTILGYYGDKGPVTMVFEAGQHHAEESILLHESAIWVILEQQKIIPMGFIDIKFHQNRLNNASKNSPALTETTMRYALKERDRFEMKQGFKNFSKIKKGDFLALHNEQNVVAPADGFLFMPLYQNQGEDGFFHVRSISSFWIRVSEFLRRQKLDYYISIFPGIKKDPKRENTFIVNTKTARFNALKILHLLGFRKERKIGNRLYISRIPYDIKGPWE